MATVVIAATGWQREGPIASLLIAALSFPRTWQLLQQAGDVLLEAPAKDVDRADIRRHMLEATG